jgi:hypothetical protein
VNAITQKELDMKVFSIRAAALVACAMSVSAVWSHAVNAQVPCALTSILVDSARDEVSSVLESPSPLVQEMRQEQHLPKSGPIGPVSVVRDRVICSRIGTQFDREIAPNVSYVVLRVGPLYYARDPDQRRGTGIITDTTFKVLLRMGASISTPPSSAAAKP